MNERKLAKVKYYEVPGSRAVVCTTQRAGSTSMVEALKPAHPDNDNALITAAEAFARRKDGWRLLMWLRDPLDRFASAFAIFGAGRIPLGRELTTLRYATPAVFADAVFQYDDAHWAPATRLHMFQGEFLPSIVYPFYNLAETWAEEFPAFPLPYRNETTRKSWNELTKELNANYVTLICKHYEEDLKMLEWCNEYGSMEAAA